MLRRTLFTSHPGAVGRLPPSPAVAAAAGGEIINSEESTPNLDPDLFISENPREDELLAHIGNCLRDTLSSPEFVSLVISRPSFHALQRHALLESDPRAVFREMASVMNTRVPEELYDQIEGTDGYIVSEEKKKSSLDESPHIKTWLIEHLSIDKLTKLLTLDSSAAPIDGIVVQFQKAPVPGLRDLVQTSPRSKSAPVNIPTHHSPSYSRRGSNGHFGSPPKETPSPLASRDLVKSPTNVEDNWMDSNALPKLVALLATAVLLASEFHANGRHGVVEKLRLFTRKVCAWVVSSISKLV